MKEQIDKFITDNYDKLLNIVRKKIAYFKRDICAIEMFSKCYMYVLENQPDKREDIPKYFMHYCNLELRYHNSVTNQRIRKSKALCFFPFDYFDIEQEQDFNQIDIEGFIKSFEESLDRVDRRVWEVMVYKGKPRLWELSSHFDIPESTIRLYRVRILNKFKQHYKEYYNED